MFLEENLVSLFVYSKNLLLLQCIVVYCHFELGIIFVEKKVCRVMIDL